MNTSTLLLLVLCVGTVFLYAEETKRDPPSGRMRLGWRLAYWGGSAVFLLGAMLAADATLVSPALRSQLCWAALFFVLVVGCGIFIQLF